MFLFFLGCLVPILIFFFWRRLKIRMTIEFWVIPKNSAVRCVGKYKDILDFPIPSLNSFVLTDIGEMCEVSKLSYDYSNKRITIILKPERGKEDIFGNLRLDC